MKKPSSIAEAALVAAVGIILIAVVLLLSGCRMPYESLIEIPVDFATVQEAMTWVAQSIEYVADVVSGDEDPDEWQLPHETVLFGTGDCEDFSLLALYIVYHMGYTGATLEIGWWPERSVGHAWVRVGPDDWDATSGTISTAMADAFSAYRVSRDYDTAMRIADRRSVVALEDTL